MGQGRDARAGRRLRERLGEVGADLAERRDAAATDLAGRVREPVLARVVLAVERALRRPGAELAAMADYAVEEDGLAVPNFSRECGGGPQNFLIGGGVREYLDA